MFAILEDALTDWPEAEKAKETDEGEEEAGEEGGEQMPNVQEENEDEEGGQRAENEVKFGEFFLKIE